MGTSQTARIAQLEKALAPQSAEETAQLFAKANKMRNGALQFMLFSVGLKQKYQAYWPNWVSGVSSPWITSYEISKSVSSDSSFTIKYNQATAAGPFEPLIQTIKIEFMTDGGSKHYVITELKPG
ncbi:MAG: hypothetical protein H0U75_12185 [Legionella sp.]|nr:hypothetical protein [Legionella sp.]